MNTFPKEKRLLNKNDFNYVFQGARKIHDEHFVVLYRNRMQGKARIGMIVGKKNIKQAYQRNRVKRLIRESFRQLNFINTDIVIIVKKGIETCNNPIIFKKLGKIWSKLNAVYET